MSYRAVGVFQNTAAKVDSDPSRRQRRDVQLTFRADVEQPAAKRDGDRQACENQRRGLKKRIADAFRVRKRAAEKNRINLKRVIADERDDDSADDKRRENGDEREKQFTKQIHC